MLVFKTPILSLAVALCLAVSPGGAQSLGAAAGQAAEAEALLEELATPDLATWEAVERKLQRIWSRSGSASADLMLQRGTDLIEEEEYLTALEHLTALTDHAPDFAEGWHVRATAFFHIEEYGLALEDLVRTLALNPKHYNAMIGVGAIEEQLGNYETALRAFEAAEQLNPHREDVAESITRLKKALGRATL